MMHYRQGHHNASDRFIDTTWQIVNIGNQWGKLEGMIDSCVKVKNMKMIPMLNYFINLIVQGKKIWWGNKIFSPNLHAEWLKITIFPDISWRTCFCTIYPMKYVHIFLVLSLVTALLSVIIVSVLQIRTICHAWNLWKLVQSCKKLHLLCLPDPWNLSGTALLSGFQSSWGALKSTE